MFLDGRFANRAQATVPYTLFLIGMVLASAWASQAGPPISVDIDTTGPIAGAPVAGGPDLPFCVPTKLLADDGDASDSFGLSVSVSGHVALVGAGHDDVNGFNSGSAYVFRWNGTAWDEEAKVLPDDAGERKNFGRSVSISGDVALVGAWGDDDNGINAGSAYVFRWTGTSWVQEQKLLAFDGVSSAFFGYSVSITGDVAVVGAYRDDDNGINAGSAYVFRWDGTAWDLEQKLLPDDGEAGDLFGESVSVSNGVALVGARSDDHNGLDSGSAYVFRWTGITWAQEQKLLADVVQATNNYFGFSVSVSGDVALVGALGGNGSAYVFRWNGAIWVQEQRLLAEVGFNDDFGRSVSVSGDVALIGAPGDDDNGTDSGSAYVFRWNGTLWLRTQKLLADDGLDEDLFGWAVSVFGDVALVGAWFDDDNGSASGSAYLFSSGGPDCNNNGEPDRCDIANGISRDLDGDGTPDICTDFCELPKLLAFDGVFRDFFGRSVSVSGDMVLVGASADDDNGIDSGSAYMFRWNGTAGVHEQKLLADDGTEDDQFGFSVSVSGNVALVGAPGVYLGTVSGSAYVFRWNGSAWVQEQKLLADDGVAGDEFGFSVSVSGDVALVGARMADEGGTGSGLAYVFRWNGTRWVQEQTLVPDSAVIDDGFGESVSVSGGVALVGARLDDDNGTRSGSAYLFRWNGTAWVQEQKLLPDDGARGDAFGSSVSVSGDVALIGAIGVGRGGSAYVFRWNGTAWAQEQELLADDEADFDRFGESVSVSGYVAVIGASGHDDNGSGSGTAYVFRWNGTAWVQKQELLAYDGATFDGFGKSVSVSGDVALVGVLGDDDNGEASGSARMFSIGVTDCNQNDMFDACDIGTGTSGDCNNNSIPDDCEIPQTCEPSVDCPVTSTWVGQAGVWDDPFDNGKWCLPESPDNNENATFDVLIEAPTAVVVLNTSPTVSTLSLSDDAVVLLNDESGANVRTLAVDGSITNRGIFRATDRERLVLDAPVIDQGGVCGEGGVLEAIDGVLGEGEEDDKSILEINGAVVLGGIAQTIGDNSEIHLIGGAELVDVCVDGVVVPDGQTGAFSGTLDNNDVLMVRGSTADTRLGPTTIDAVLDSTSGVGSIRLTSQSFARLGDFKTSFTNSEGHRIEGAGIIFGGLTNEGRIEANSSTGDLILFPPGTKINRGALRAMDGGTLRIEDSVAQASPAGTVALIEALANGAIMINADITGDGALRAIAGTATVNDVSVTLAQVDIDQAGKLLVDGNANVVVSGIMTVSGGGVYEATDPPSGLVSASLLADSVAVTCNSHLLLSQSMSLTTTGSLEILGLATLSGAVRGGCDPPGYGTTGDSRVDVDGDFVLHDLASAEHASTEPLVLQGDFDIRSTSAQFFAWESGAIRLAGGDDTATALQTYEVAGADLGPDIGGFNSNFAVDSVEVTAGSCVEFSNATPNVVNDMPCSEALYAHTLSFRADSQVTLTDCRVYYLFLENEGVAPTFSGDANCAALVQIPSGDFNGDRSIDLLDYREFVECLTSPGVRSLGETCGTFDFDFDLDVDLVDFSAFQRRFMRQIR